MHTTHLFVGGVCLPSSMQTILNVDTPNADPPRAWTEWHTLVKTLPCPKLRLRTVTMTFPGSTAVCIKSKRDWAGSNRDTCNKTKFPPEICRAKSKATLRTCVHIACPNNLCHFLLALSCFHTYVSNSPICNPVSKNSQRNNFSLPLKGQGHEDSWGFPNKWRHRTIFRTRPVDRHSFFFLNKFCGKTQ